LPSEDVEELREVFNVLSTQVPALIKGIITSVFSEETGIEMGKAAGAFYKGLIEAGVPAEAALKMTENYISVFTNLSELLKKISAREGGREKESKSAADSKKKTEEKSEG